MRNKLKKINGQRDVFTGVFVQTGHKNGYMESLPTLLLKNIKDKSGQVICDHLWMNETKGFQQLDLTEGDVVEFSAKVEKYLKGYFGHREEIQLEKPIHADYKLSRPTKVKRIGWQKPEIGIESKNLSKASPGEIEARNQRKAKQAAFKLPKHKEKLSCLTQRLESDRLGTAVKRRIKKQIRTIQGIIAELEAKIKAYPK